MKDSYSSTFNPYGARESLILETATLSLLIRKAVRREIPFVVWGDGSERLLSTLQTWSRPIWHQKRKLMPIPNNLGSSTPITIRDCELILCLTGHTRQIEWDTSKPGRWFKKANMSKALSIGWKQNPLREGLEKTLDWYLERKRD